jgi:uncharacterized protein
MLGVWHVLVIFVVALVVGCLLGGKPLHEQAEAMDDTALRTAALAVTGPFATASDFLRLDKAWEWAAGRPADEVADGGDGPDDSSEQAGGATGTTLLTVTGSTVASGTTTTSVAATVRSTTTYSTSTSSTTTTLPLFTAKAPLKVLVVGDSLVAPVGWGLMRQSEIHPALKVDVIYKVSSGLVRPDFYDWPKALTAAVAKFHPNVTVVLFGGNDKQNMRFEGKLLEPFSEEWKAEYYERVSDFMNISTVAGSRVVWIGMPIMRSPKFSQTARWFNFMYNEMCGHRPDTANYVDGYALFADDQGQYSAYLIDSSGERKLMREKDGIHLTNAGGDRAAEAVVEVLLEHFRLGP